MATHSSSRDDSKKRSFHNNIYNQIRQTMFASQYNNIYIYIYIYIYILVWLVYQSSQYVVIDVRHLIIQFYVVYSKLNNETICTSNDRATFFLPSFLPNQAYILICWRIVSTCVKEHMNKRNIRVDHVEKSNIVFFFVMKLSIREIHFPS